MIILDTHIWIWWVNQSDELRGTYQEYIQEHEDEGIGVCAITCWELAKLVELKRVDLKIDVEKWIAQALCHPKTELLPLSFEIAVASTRLPGSFHRDPADQIIVASARHFDCNLVTMDSKILNYPHVKSVQLTE